MFFSRRVVPQTPPSLVKLSASALDVDDRFANFGAEQRPGARTQKRDGADAITDATADPVSWHAGATTGVPAHVVDAIGCRRADDRCPASTIGCSNRPGNPISSNKSIAHVRVRASTICVVVAIVYSDTSVPDSQ